MNNLSIENLIIIFLLVILIAWTIVLQIWVSRTRKKVKIFLKGKKVKDLEEVISEQIKRMRGIENDVKNLSDWNEKLQKICDISVTKIGVVRFNPFKDTGGDQSFAIALLDSKNNGLVLSSLHSREGTRIYAKPIENGASSYNLTDEEQGAIKKAIHE
jgi:cell division protein FtsL